MRSTYLYIGYFFLLLLAFVLLGFYKTCIVLFPEFNGISLVKHFHGASLFIWFLMMIIQPFLMHFKQYKMHKAIAKVSYVIVPMVMISIFLVSRDKYHRMEPIIPHSENIGELALNIPSIFYFGLLYVLAMYYRKNKAYHVRFMIANALLIFGPGIGRAFIIYGGANFSQSVVFAIITTEIITLSLLINDIIRKQPYRPYLIALLFQISFHIVWYLRYTPFWQNIGDAFASVFF